MLQHVDVYKKGLRYSVWLIIAMTEMMSETTSTAVSIDVYTEACPMIEMTGFHLDSLQDMYGKNFTVLEEQTTNYAFGCKNIFNATKTVCSIASKSSTTDLQMFYTCCSTGKYLTSLFKSLGITHKQYQFESNCIEEVFGQEDSIRARISDVVRFFAEVIKRWGWNNIVVFTDTEIGNLQQECSKNYISAVIVRVKKENDALTYLKMESDELTDVTPHFFVLCNPLNTRRVLHAANITKFIEPPNTWIIMSDMSLSLFDNLTVPFDSFLALVTTANYIPATKQQPAALLVANTTSFAQTEALKEACTQFVLEKKETHSVKVQDNELLSPLELQIYEVYSVESGPLHFEMFGSWMSSSGTLFAWKMFPNLLRKIPEVHFTIVTIDNPPYIILEKEGNKYSVKGYFAAVLDILAHEMQFKYTIIRAEDSQFGNKLANGSWNGMIGYLARKEADIALADLSKTMSRMEVVDYTPPISHTSHRIIYRKPQEGVHYKVYIMPFGWQTWLLVLLTIIIPAILLRICNRLSPCSSLHADPEEGFNDDDFSLPNCLLIMYGGFVQQGFEVDPKEVSGKIIVITVYIAFVVVFAVYTSIFTSFLTVGNDFLPFTTLEELLKNRDYKLGLRNNSVFGDYCQNTSNKIYQEAWNMMSEDPNNFVPDVMSGIEKAYTSKFGFITPELSTRSLLKSNCSFIISSEKLMPESTHWAFRKDFQYAEVFTQYMDRMHESGVLNRLSRVFEGDELSLCEDSSGAQSLGIKRVLSLFLLLAMATIMAGIILLIECKATARPQKGTLKHVKPLSFPYRPRVQSPTKPKEPVADRFNIIGDLNKDSDGVENQRYTYSDFNKDQGNTTFRSMYSNRTQSFMIPMQPTYVPRNHFFKALTNDNSLK